VKLKVGVGVEVGHCDGEVVAVVEAVGQPLPLGVMQLVAERLKVPEAQAL